MGMVYFLSTSLVNSVFLAEWSLWRGQRASSPSPPYKGLKEEKPMEKSEGSQLLLPAPMQGTEGGRGPGTAVSSSLCGWESGMCVLVFKLFQNQKIMD